MSVTRRALIAGIGAAGAASVFGAGYAVGAGRSAIAAAKQRVSQSSRILPTPFGALEYAVAGRGEPLLMIHGTGGGYDQGLRFAGSLLDRGFQVISPSRFGYLRSDFPADPRPQRQAEAFAFLLDHLGINRLTVAGGSAGALSAAAFALRFPDRVSKLALLVPATNLSGRDPVAFSRPQQFFVSRLLTSDAWFWSASALAPREMIGTILATDPALLDVVSPKERERAFLILSEILPISLKVKGIAADGHYAGTPTDLRIEGIRAPLLLISAEDDRFATAETARTIAALVPAARLKIFPTGGHIWLGHDDDVAAEIAGFTSTDLAGRQTVTRSSVPA